MPVNFGINSNNGVGHTNVANSANINHNNSLSRFKVLVYHTL